MARKNFDPIGVTLKENKVQRSFWHFHKVENMMAVAGKELDAIIDKWLEENQARNIKRNPSWWYPNMTTNTMNDIRNKRSEGLDKRRRFN